jgi:hypothetical protein
MESPVALQSGWSMAGRPAPPHCDEQEVPCSRISLADAELHAACGVTDTKAEAHNDVENDSSNFKAGTFISF